MPLKLSPSPCLSALVLGLALCAYGAIELAGYKTSTDVTEHARLDRDVEELDKLLGEEDFSEAKKIYSDGKNSDKSEGKRTLEGFSTSAGDKMKDEGYFKLFRDYWGKDDYAHRFVSDALDGDGDFSDVEPVFRSQCALKGAQYQSVWMYVVHEMEDAIGDCSRDDPNDNDDDKVVAWDEAVAFYTGSLLGRGLANANNSEGFMPFSLAEKRCIDFGTCEEVDGEKVSKVNTRVMALFNEGKNKLLDSDCNGAVGTKNSIVRQMIVPLVQGVQRYLIRFRDSGNSKDHAEGWAFAAAMLPFLDFCDEGAAEQLRNTLKPGADKPSDIDPIIQSMEDQYKCMGFECSDVGREEGVVSECRSTSSFKAVPGTDELVEGGGGLSGGAIAGIVIGVLAVAALVVWLVLRRRKKPKMGETPITPIDESDTFA